MSSFDLALRGAELPPPTTMPPVGVALRSPSDYLLPEDGDQPQKENEDIETDIYRGMSRRPRSSSRSRAPSAHSSSNPATSTTSSSSSSTGGWGRGRGAIAALVEKAISRWARGTSDTSSSSSSSSSSSDASRGRSRSKRRRSSQRHRSNTAINEHNLSPSRIARARQLLEHSRRLPREYVLFLPPALAPTLPSLEPVQAQQQRTLRTSSTRLILAQLESILKRPSRHPTRRNKVPRSLPLDQHHPKATPSHSNSSHVGGELAGPSDPKKAGKGKAKQIPLVESPLGVTDEQPPKPGELADSQNPRAWWLDVASPSWDDMRALGKLLHLHPLTLEDILQQEPREKLELFPRLGYYFVVFRALDSSMTIQNTSNQSSEGQTSGSNIGSVNVYLVVFREGICSFHFEDISQHLDRVRNKVLKLEETVWMTSDWLAHGLIDSIVDAFVPLIDSIEREVDELDTIVSDIDSGNLPQGANRLTSLPTGTPEKRVLNEENAVSTRTMEEKTLPPSKHNAPDDDPPSHHVSIPIGSFQFPPHIQIRQVRVPRWGLRWLLPAKLALAISSDKGQPHRSARYTILLRMAGCRRLVTALTRVLGPKYEVVAQMRKRILLLNSLGGETRAAGLELDIYLGDVQDHIVTMQQSLSHYERILSHSHPTYLSHLRYALSEAKGGMDDAILYLSVATVCFFATQVVTMLLGTNIHVPHNAISRDPPGPYYVFGIAVVLACLAAAGVLLMVRIWWLQAKKKYRRSEQI